MTDLPIFEKLKAAGVPEEQARIQAEALRNQNEAQANAINKLIAEREREIATKGDLRETELRLQKEIREVELKLQKEI